LSNEEQPNPGAQTLDLMSVLRPVRKFWLTSVLVALTVGLGSALYTLSQTKIYEAAATVLFDPNPPRPLGQRVEGVVELGAGQVYDTYEYYQTQYQLIRSTRIAKRVVSALQLHRDAGFVLSLPAGVAPPDGFAPIDEENAAMMVRGRVSVDPIKGSRMANVRFTDTNPERAARILSVLVDAYVDQNLEDSLSTTANAADWLRDQLSTLETDLDANEMSLHEYKMDKNILSVAFDDQSNMLRGQMAQLSGRLTELADERAGLQARVTELAKVGMDNPTDLPASEFTKSEILSSLRGKYQEAVAARDAVRERIGEPGPNHPEMRGAEAAVTASTNALLAEVKNIRGALERDLAIVKRHEADLAGQFERAKKQALELNLLEIEYGRLRRSKDNTEKLYALVQERTKESDLARMLRVNNIQVVDRPRPPGGPVRPNVPLNIMAGALLGVALGIAAALARGLLDRTVKTPDDVEKGMGATFLGLIPEVQATKVGARRRRSLENPGAPELIVHHSPMSAIAEAARAIRTNLLFMAPDKPYRTLLITSAGPSEGKTTVACCIATAMAQAGKTVVLVDCDLRRPRVHRVFGKRNDTGLTTALLGEGEEAAADPTEVPNLWVMTAGPIPPNPAELLQSERFRGWLKRMEARYDHVILDSSPLVAVTDAAILLTIADGTLIVVRAFKTRKELAAYSLRTLRDVSARVAGVVLNAVNLNRDEYRYSYQYYRRDQYYSEGSPPEPPAESPARQGGGNRGRGLEAGPPQ
jgi:succinoglycan biosynthesis transport protein ExoP